MQTGQNGNIFREWKTDSASVAQLVEHHVANVIVAGSNPVTRSISCLSVDRRIFNLKNQQHRRSPFRQGRLCLPRRNFFFRHYFRMFFDCRRTEIISVSPQRNDTFSSEQTSVKKQHIDEAPASGRVAIVNADISRIQILHDIKQGCRF